MIHVFATAVTKSTKVAAILDDGNHPEGHTHGVGVGEGGRVGKGPPRGAEAAHVSQSTAGRRTSEGRGTEVI